MLKRYSPGAAESYLRAFAEGFALDYFSKHLREDANERERSLLNKWAMDRAQKS